jgi:hypothetical protein
MTSSVLALRRISTAVAGACAVIAACGGGDGVSSDVFATSPPRAEAGASNPPQDGVSVTDGGTQANRGEAGAPADAAGGCPALSGAPDDGSRFVVALRSTKPEVIDGDFSDYDGCVSVVLDGTTAARVKGTPAASAKIMIEWDPSALWIAAEVLDAQLEGTDTEHPYFNDSLELYISSAGLRTGDYGPYDHQFVVDYKDLALAYPGAGPLAPKATAHAYPIAGGYRIEMRASTPSSRSAAASRWATFASSTR